MAQSLYESDPQLRIDQRWLAACVGLVAFFLPVVLLLGAAFDPPLRQSISHFYYVPVLGDIFVGALVFIGTFLIVYRGLLPQERWISTVAGFCAYGVALFPTSGEGIGKGASFARILMPVTVDAAENQKDPPIVTLSTKFTSYFELFPGVDYLHFGSAAVLFGFLAYCSIFVFTRPNERDPDAASEKPKLMRNGAYYVCGALIVVAMAALFLKLVLGLDTTWNRWKLTFLCEWVALWAFGFSWLVKGRFFMQATPLMDAEEKADKALVKLRKKGASKPVDE